MRIFNGHAGIGGNRAAWGEKHEVTACELDPAIAGVYAERTKSKLSDFDDMGVSLDGSGIKNKRQAFRNAVDPELGLHVLKAAKAARKAARA